jgi:hypothetical protein
MVKGISRQVIVVQSPDPKLFEQAIFILREGQRGISDDMLLKEANRMLSRHSARNSRRISAAGPVWAIGGAMITGLIWLTTALL